jgi:hypothetical protein
MENGFSPIDIDDIVAKYHRANPGENRDAFVKNLRAAIAAHRSGTRCSCGEPIWVLGSALAGSGCFACITGESTPDSDYEVVVPSGQE